MITHHTSHLSPLTRGRSWHRFPPAALLAVGRARLPGFVGPIPPPLLMREQLFNCGLDDSSCPLSSQMAGRAACQDTCIVCTQDLAQRRRGPASEQALGGDADTRGVLLTEAVAVEGKMAHDGQILGTVAGPGTALILAEGDGQHPMPPILDLPLTSPGTTGRAIPSLPTGWPSSREATNTAFPSQLGSISPCVRCKRRGAGAAGERCYAKWVAAVRSRG